MDLEKTVSKDGIAYQIIYIHLIISNYDIHLIIHLIYLIMLLDVNSGMRHYIIIRTRERSRTTTSHQP